MISRSITLLILEIWAKNVVFIIPEFDKSVKIQKHWKIQQFQSKLPHEISSHILTIHGFFAGDQVSKIHGTGKGSMLSKLNPRESKYSNKFCEAIKSFTQASQSDCLSDKNGENIYLGHINNSDENIDVFCHK